MIIFLYGPDDYRREAKKREIVAEFEKKRSGLGIGKFDLAGDGGLERFKEFLVSQSLFQLNKLAVLSSTFEVEAKELAAILKEVLVNKEVTVLISESGKLAKALEFLKKKPLLFQEFEFLKGREWENFVMGEIKKRNLNVSPSGVKFLTQVYEGNTWGLVTELDKIQHLGSPSPEAGSGSRAVIGTRDLEDLGVEQAPNFWSLILGFKSKSLPQKLWALEKFFGSNEPAAKVFNILAYQLPDKLSDLARYDLMVKSGKLEYEEVLVDLAID